MKMNDHVEGGNQLVSATRGRAPYLLGHTQQHFEVMSPKLANNRFPLTSELLQRKPGENSSKLKKARYKSSLFSDLMSTKSEGFANWPLRGPIVDLFK